MYVIKNIMKLLRIKPMLKYIYFKISINFKIINIKKMAFILIRIETNYKNGEKILR